MHRTTVFDLLQEQLAVFQTPGVLADTPRTIRVIEQVKLIIVDGIRSQAAPSRHSIVNPKDAPLQAQLPDPANRAVVGAAPAAPPLRLGRVELGISSIQAGMDRRRGWRGISEGRPRLE